MAVDLDDYRLEADRFLAALHEEYYLQLSGQKQELALKPIYERHADLMTLATCRELGEAGATELWRFACEGYLGRLTAAEAERLAALEATLEAEVEGTRIPYRMLRPAIANEPDRERRERLERARLRLLGELNPVYLEALASIRDASVALGASSYGDLYRRFGFPLEALAGQCARFLEETDERYERSMDGLLRDTVGVSLTEARYWDLPRVWRAPRFDDAFPPDGMVPALAATLEAWGVALERQHNVALDLEPRPAKDPRAVCFPIEVPARIVLSVKPIGGMDDWRALFHEAGHAEHFAHTAAHLSFEARRLGDDAVSEGFAFLLENLVSDREWLSRRLGVDARSLEAAWASMRLYLARSLCGSLLYELELYEAPDPAAMAERYAERLMEATAIAHPPEAYLDRVDPGFYATSYLRGLALEALLRAHLRERFGAAWMWNRKAGALLRELWYEGQGMRADAIADELTGEPLELSALADELARVLR